MWNKTLFENRLITWVLFYIRLQTWCNYIVYGLYCKEKYFYISWFKDLGYCKRMWVTAWQNQQNDIRPAKTRISQSSLCTQCVAKGPRFLHADNGDWSDWADDLSLRWPHILLVLSCSGSCIFNVQSFLLWAIQDLTLSLAIVQSTQRIIF